MHYILQLVMGRNIGAYCLVLRYCGEHSNLIGNSICIVFSVSLNKLFSAIENADQSVVDRAINDICILLQCSRHNLNVVSTPIDA